MPRRAPPPTPLFTWQREQEIARLEAQRAALAAATRILRPRCHKRIIREARLAELTCQSLSHTLERRHGADPEIR